MQKIVILWDTDAVKEELNLNALSRYLAAELDSKNKNLCIGYEITVEGANYTIEELPF